MTKHTTGSWNWTEGNPSITRTWNGTEHTIATVGLSTLSWHEDPVCAAREAGANARLIAAAPDLLEALKRFIPLVEEFEEHLKVDLYWFEKDERLVKAEELINTVQDILKH